MSLVPTSGRSSTVEAMKAGEVEWLFSRRPKVPVRLLTALTQTYTQTDLTHSKGSGDFQTSRGPLGLRAWPEYSPHIFNGHPNPDCHPL